MEERNLSLKEATKFLLEPAARDQAQSITNWKNIVETFIESRSDRRDKILIINTQIQTISIFTLNKRKNTCIA